MDILRQRLFVFWAQYWLPHTLQKAAEVGLGVVMVGSAVTVVVTATPVHHTSHPVKPVSKVTAPPPAHPPTKHSATVAASPPPPPAAKPVATPAAKSAPVTQAPQPIPASQPSPGSGVKKLVPSTPGSSASTPPPNTSDSSGDTPPSTLPAGTTSTAPALASGGYYSTNWSGYAALSGKFTGVSGSWTVPAVTGTGTATSGDAAWIGIGGVSSSDLIQTGTDDIVAADGTVSTFAFYELLPDPALEIQSLKVQAGDVMNASVTELSSGQWKISITDTTTNQTYTTTVSYSSTYSSAEWIEEDPSYLNGSLVPFAGFDHVVFSSGSTTLNNSSVSIGGSKAAPITLVDSANKPVVAPSVLLNSGTGFWAIHN